MSDSSVRLLRSSPDELEVYVTRIAELTGIPAAHLEKDFWVTEVLRGAANASASTGYSVIFKGGTSLSKAHRLIERFSEDVDLNSRSPTRRCWRRRHKAEGVRRSSRTNHRCDDQRRSATARHYYDVDQLLRNERVLVDLEQVGIDILAREITQHSRAAGLPTAERPAGGFSTSPAWNTPDRVTIDSYDSVLNELIWPMADASPIDQCCQRVHDLAEFL